VDTQWVLVTNGDNEYASSFFEKVAAVNDTDLVAVDYYSRYQRVTGMAALSLSLCCLHHCCICNVFHICLVRVQQ
jgi:hypothetical protein